MDVITTLHAQLQKLNEDLNFVTVEVKSQESQLSAIEEERTDFEKSMEDATHQSNQISQKLDMEFEALFALETQNQKMERDIMYLENTLEELPNTLCNKICAAYFNSSLSYAAQFEGEFTQAINGNFWLDKIRSCQESIEEHVNHLRQKTALTFERKEKEKRYCDQLLQAEEESLNLILASIEAYDNKNNDLRQQLSSNSYSGCRSYQENRDVLGLRGGGSQWDDDFAFHDSSVNVSNAPKEHLPSPSTAGLHAQRTNHTSITQAGPPEHSVTTAEHRYCVTTVKETKTVITAEKEHYKKPTDLDDFPLETESPWYLLHKRRRTGGVDMQRQQEASQFPYTFDEYGDQ